MKAKGRVHKFGDDINTDEIIPAKFLNTSDAAELASHCMEGISDAAAKSLNKGDIIVGGRNFGCGSSRARTAVGIRSTVGYGQRAFDSVNRARRQGAIGLWNSFGWGIRGSESGAVGEPRRRKGHSVSQVQPLRDADEDGFWAGTFCSPAGVCR